MNAPTPDVLSLAFDVVTGRARAGDPLPADVLAFATKVVALGRLVAATPACPARALRRAEALFHAPRARGVAAVWRTVFDSWQGVAPALRGAGRPRFLRLAGENGSLHVEVVADPAGGTRLRGTLDGPRADTRLELVADDGAAVTVAVEDGGAFEASLPAGAHEVRLAVRVGRRVVARSEAVPVGPA